MPNEQIIDTDFNIDLEDDDTDPNYKFNRAIERALKNLEQYDDNNKIIKIGAFSIERDKNGV